MMLHLFSRSKSLWGEQRVCMFTRTLLTGAHGNVRVQQQVLSLASHPFTISGRNASNDRHSGKSNPILGNSVYTPGKNLEAIPPKNTVSYSLKSLVSKLTSFLSTGNNENFKKNVTVLQNDAQDFGIKMVKVVQEYDKKKFKKNMMEGKDKLASELNIYDMESVKKNAKGFRNDAKIMGVKLVSVVHEYDNKIKIKAKNSAKGLGNKLQLVLEMYDHEALKKSLKDYNQVHTDSMKQNLYKYKQGAHESVLVIGNKAKDIGNQLDSTLKKNLKESVAHTKIKARERTDTLNHLYKLYKNEAFEETLNNYKKGARTELNDLKNYIKVWAYKSNSVPLNVQGISYSDLLAHNRFKRNGLKTLSLLLFPFIPKVGFYMLALPLITPRVMLSENVWSENQKIMYQKYNHFVRTQNFKEMVSFMQNHSQKWNHEGKDVVEKVAQSLMDKQVFLTNEELQTYKTVCRHDVFSLEVADPELIHCLCRVHQLSTFGTLDMLRSRLHNQAVDILEMDYKLREMNLKRLSPEDLSIATHLRGLDATSLSYDAKLFWLQNWLHLTETCSRTNDSFVLQVTMIQSINYDEELYKSLLSL